MLTIKNSLASTKCNIHYRSHYSIKIN